MTNNNTINVVEKEILDNLNKIKYDFQDFSVEECGRIISIKDDIVNIIGLQNVFFNEIVVFEDITDFNPHKKLGIVISINEYSVSVICFDNYSLSISNTIAKRTGKFLEVLVSKDMLGHTFNGYGIPITDIMVSGGVYKDINLIPPTMLDIEYNNEQLITGMPIIDIITPIAYGQRQAIIGDAGTGKTTILSNIIDSIKNKPQTITIYLSIGQNITNVKNLEHNLRSNHNLSYIMINVNASSSSLEKYLSPFVALSIAEYFKSLQYNVVVLIDDMNSHTYAYQDIMTRIKQPMGKEGLPSDIFYQHALILSMGHVHKNKGTITILPVVNTLDEDITDYLVTNIMSITDGQIIMSSDKAKSRIYPAINIGKSVSRIGRNIQYETFKKLCTEAMNIVVKYNNLKDLLSFNNTISSDTVSQEIWHKGEAIYNILFYNNSNRTLLEQITILQLILHHKIYNMNIEILKNIINSNIDHNNIVNEYINRSLHESKK